METDKQSIFPNVNKLIQAIQKVGFYVDGGNTERMMAERGVSLGKRRESSVQIFGYGNY